MPSKVPNLDATRNWDCRYPAQRTARREPAGFAMPFIQPDNGTKDVFVHISAVDGTATNRVTVARQMPGSCLGGKGRQHKNLKSFKRDKRRL
jgi:'Cold-shock' DNA-binding domain